MEIRWNVGSVVTPWSPENSSCPQKDMEDSHGQSRGSDGGLGEGDPQVVVLSQVMVVELDEGLDCFLH